MAATGRKRHLMDIAYEEMKASILSNRLKPGEMLGEIQLGETLHMSRTPIREAIRRLEMEGLVEVKDGVGTFVTAFSAEDIADAYEVRRAMELLAIQTAIGEFQEEELRELRETFQGIAGRLEENDMVTIDECADADWRFHNMIIEKSKNRFVKTAMASISMNVRRYQYMSVHVFHNVAQGMQEHLAIVDAIGAGDVARAGELLQKHIAY